MVKDWRMFTKFGDIMVPQLYSIDIMMVYDIDHIESSEHVKKII